MPYTIIVCDDNTLYGSRKRKIMQREKLFNKLQILVPPCYNGYDMSKCIVTMRYLLPVSKEFKTETLTLSGEGYEEYLKYVLPIDTCLTKEWGDIELNLTFIMLDVDNNGNVVQRVRKTGNHILTITKTSDWDSIIPDSALQSLDQRIMVQSAQIKALADIAIALDNNMVDNLVYNEKEESLQLSARGIGVGDKVSVRDMIDEGIPVVDMDSDSDEGSNDNDGGCGNCDDCECEENVVEFGYYGSGSFVEPTDDSNVVNF